MNYTQNIKVPRTCHNAPNINALGRANQSNPTCQKSQYRKPLCMCCCCRLVANGAATPDDLRALTAKYATVLSARPFHENQNYHRKLTEMIWYAALSSIWVLCLCCYVCLLVPQCRILYPTPLRVLASSSRFVFFFLVSQRYEIPLGAGRTTGPVRALPSIVRA